jgi:adenine specific DNA methylase Mod
MARTKPVSFQKRLEKRIIEKLVVQPSTIGSMADLLGENYHSCRKVFKSLEEQGFLYVRGYSKGSAIYRLTEPDPTRKNNSIPTVKGRTGDPIKVTAMLANVGKEDKSAGAPAAIALPRIASRIFMAALRNVESHGEYDVQKNLRNIRTEIETNLQILQNTVAYYEAFLQADVFWDPFKIKAIPYDEDFNKDEVIAAYRHYYPED